MQERQLQFLFNDFLKSKGYPIQSLLYEVRLRASFDTGMLRPDLVILDIVSNEYVALVEFKNKFTSNEEKAGILQLNNYLSVLGTNLPAFLVFPISEDDFQILVLDGNYFEPIAKEDFPTFESLISNNLAYKKIEQIEIEKDKFLYLESKKKKAWVSSIFSILSIIAGVLFTLISIKYQIKSDNLTAISSSCCDTIDSKLKEIEKKIKLLEIYKVPVKNETINVSPNVTKLENRISIIEKGISETPEKTLSVLSINQKIQMLEQTNSYTKEIMQSKIDALKGEMSMQSLWMTGVLIAIFGCILSFTIPVLVAKIKENWLK